MLDHGPVTVVKTLVIPEGYRPDPRSKLVSQPSVGISKQAYAKAVAAAVAAARVSAIT